MSLGKVLNEHFSGLWKSFPCPTDTIDDYDNILWLNEDYPSKEEIQAKIAELEAAEPMRLLRLERNQLLQQTDWTQNRDVTLANDAEWAAYRQALRDLPNTATPELDEHGNLTNVTWPEKPA